MIFFKYHNKVKKVNIDRHSSIDDVIAVVTNLFHLKARLIGMLDQDGSFYDINSFMQNMHTFQAGQRIVSLVTDESGMRLQQSLSRSKYNQDSMVSEIFEHEILPPKEPSSYRKHQLEQQSSLKYSQVSESTSQFGFIDFVYEMEEFQSLLNGDGYTVVLLLDENDPVLADFLGSLEGLIQHFSQFISFYYTYHNRLHKSSTSKLVWFYKGNKKILQIVLNNPQKMRQFEELLLKVQVAKIEGRNVSQFTSPDRQQHYSSAQQQYDQPYLQMNSSLEQTKRSKSIKRLVEQSSIRNQSVTASYSQQNQARQPQMHKYITHIQAKVIPRNSNDFYHPHSNIVSRNSNDYPQPNQGSLPIQRTNGLNNYYEERAPVIDRPQTVATQKRNDDSHMISMQDQLIQLATDLESSGVLDMQIARVVKRMILEENKQVIMVLNSYINKIYDERVLCEKLGRLIDRNEQDYHRPGTPSQQQESDKNQRKSKPRPETQQAEVNISSIKRDIFEANIQQFAPEEYGIAMYLLQNHPDPILINLAREAHIRMSKNNAKPNLVAILTYVRGKFNEFISKTFNYQEQQIISDFKTKRTSSVYAIFQCFRYEGNLEDFLESLKKAILTLNIISSNSSSSITHSKQKMQQTSICKNIPSQLNEPQIVIQVSPIPSQTKSEKKERLVVPPLQKYSHDIQRNTDFSPKQEISLFQKDHIHQYELAQAQHLNLASGATGVEQYPKAKVRSSSPRKKERTANEEIFSEEEFMRIKLQKRKDCQNQIEAFYNTQRENDLADIFENMITQVKMDDQHKVTQLYQLMDNFDSKLYDILKNFSSFKSVSQTNLDLRKLLTQEQTDPNYIQDYRKQKAFNLFKNQVRQFCIQKHLIDIHKNFLLKMFLEEDIQVLGSLETYLINGDAQDMLDTMKTIIQQYGKYINIQSYCVSTPYESSRRPSTDRRDPGSAQRQLGDSQQPSFIVQESRIVINRFRQYFNAEQKERLDKIATSESKTIYELFQYQQSQHFADLNGFIQKMMSLTIDQPYSRRNSQPRQSDIERKIDKLVTEGLLKIDEFIVDKIAERESDPLIQGLLEYYKKTQSKQDFAENIKMLGRILQKQLILETIEALSNETNWSQDKKAKLIRLTNQEYPILLGGFAVYFRCPPAEKEMEKSELIDTLNRIV